MLKMGKKLQSDKHASLRFLGAQFLLLSLLLSATSALAESCSVTCDDGSACGVEQGPPRPPVDKAFSANLGGLEAKDAVHLQALTPTQAALLEFPRDSVVDESTAGDELAHLRLVFRRSGRPLSKVSCACAPGGDQQAVCIN